MSLTPGTRLGVYDITAQLGEGGMGQVFRATDTKLKRQVAIKVLPPSVATDHDRLARFQREAEVLASLNHPHIAGIYGLEESEGVSALVMELVEGEDLSQRVARGAIPIDEALPIARQIAEALAAAHEQGIIHRDLKPANIKVRDDGTVKVLDFGLAKAVEQGSAIGDQRSGNAANSPTITSPAMTMRGVILGTAAYMSPEQARGRAVDKRSDIWAFGCVLFEMLTGTRAFDGEDVSYTLAAILTKTPDLMRLPPTTPPSITRLLRRCLRREPNQRLHDITDARLEIQDAIAGDDTASVPAPARQWRETIAWSLAAVAIVTAIGVVWWARRDRGAPASTANEYQSSLQLPADLTLFGPTADRFAISPDGRRLAFIADGAGQSRQLWVRPLDGLVAQPLAGTDGASALFWSADSRSIGFFALGKIKRIDAAGGPATAICDYAPRVTPNGATWNRNGDILFSVAAGQGGLNRVSATGGTPEVVAKPDSAAGEFGYVRPVFLPDGNRFLYSTIAAAPDRGGPGRASSVSVSSLNRRERTLLIEDAEKPLYSSGYVLFLRGAGLVAQAFDPEQMKMIGAPLSIADVDAGGAGGGLRGAYSASDTGVLVYRAGSGGGSRRLTWFDRNGKSIGTLGDRGNYREIELSADRSKVAVSVVAPNAEAPDVWIIDVARGVPLQLASGPDWESQPVWAPEGNRVVFASREAGRQALRVREANGAGADESLLIDDAFNVPVSWSPDGRFILYVRRASARRSDGDQSTPLMSGDLWVLPLIGDRKPYAVPGPQRAQNARYSPDGRWIALTSTESGRPEIYVVSFPGPGGKWRVSPAGGINPVWRRDGKELYFQAPDGQLMVAAVNGRGSTFEIGATTALFDTTVRGMGAAGKFFDATADGQRFLVSVQAEDPRAATLTLVVNWPERLKR